MSNKLTQVARLFCSSPWAILPEKYLAISHLIEMRAAGHVLSAEEIQAAVAQKRASGAKLAGSVAVIPIYGVIAPRANIMTQFSGGTSLDSLAADYRAALESNDVKAIVFDIDSPGGQVQGLPEFASELLANRGQKKTYAVATGYMASAAYWIGSCVDQVIGSPSAQIGSIGVIMQHCDISKMEEQEGIKTTIISAGKYKAEANPYQPLTDDDKSALQASVDECYEMFIQSVAKARKTNENAVRTGYGQGRVLMSASALAAGLIDKVGTIDQLFAGLGVTDSRKKLSAVAGTGVMRAIDAAACECDCAPCVAGDCDLCTDEGCDCVGCDCPMKLAARSRAQAARLRALDLF